MPWGRSLMPILFFRPILAFCLHLAAQLRCNAWTAPVQLHLDPVVCKSAVHTHYTHAFGYISLALCNTCCIALYAPVA